MRDVCVFFTSVLGRHEIFVFPGRGSQDKIRSLCPPPVSQVNTKRLCSEGGNIASIGGPHLQTLSVKIVLGLGGGPT